MALTFEEVIPATGEWVLSTDPNRYVVVMVNDTEFLKQYDRVAIMCSIGKPIGVDDPSSEFQPTIVKVHGLSTVDGRVPGEKITFTPECNDFLLALGQRIGDALNHWLDTTSKERMEEIWAMGNRNLLDVLLEAITASSFGKLEA
jgi:hypothetical protein